MKKIEIEVTDEVYEKLTKMTSNKMSMQNLFNIIIARFLNK
ncbi:hypothetical protein [Poseidonibacter ostreae]|nr:hypothetical protein [Poseidonibacter ostreae]